MTHTQKYGVFSVVQARRRQGALGLALKNQARAMGRHRRRGSRSKWFPPVTLSGGEEEPPNSSGSEKEEESPKRKLQNWVTKRVSGNSQGLLRSFKLRRVNLEK